MVKLQNSDDVALCKGDYCYYGKGTNGQLVSSALALFLLLIGIAALVRALS